MNYSEMSDFEINKAAALAAGYQLSSDFQSLLDEFAPGCVNVIIDGSQSTFDPCNSWADAGQIIEKNHIDLIWYELDACWGAHKGMPCAYDHRPLRAAMIVFLMMNESKKEGGF